MRHVTRPFILILVLALVLAACGGDSGSDGSDGDGASTTSIEGTDATTGGPGEAETITIGFTASVTGRYNVESSRQLNGLQLWMDDVNDAGGITLSDGTNLVFEAVSYDDESNTDRVQELYTQLATEDEADFLISPYSSGLTASAAVIAEQYGKVMITTGAASDATYQQGLSLVYQAYTPASRYLTSAVDMLAEVDPDARKIAFVYENSDFSTAVVDAALAYAETKGFDVVLHEGYDPETSDFNAFINKIEASEPDAILGGGHFQDGSTFARQLNEKQVELGMLALLVAPPEPTFEELGDAAIGVVGPSQWEPAAQYTEAAAADAGIDWIGPTSEEFTKTYTDKYGEEPSYHSAGGYVAGLLIQAAIEAADSYDQAEVAAALDALDLLTFFGHMQFDTSAENHGLQIGHDMILVQWQGEAGNLNKEVVWPTAGATSDPIYPMGG